MFQDENGGKAGCLVCEVENQFIEPTVCHPGDLFLLTDAQNGSVAGKA